MSEPPHNGSGLPDRPSSHPWNLAEVVALAKQGDPQAFRKLVEHFYEPVLRSLTLLLRDRDDASDVAQETFLRAWEKLSDLREPGSFQFWLYRSAFRKGCTLLRRRPRYIFIRPQEISSADPDECDAESGQRTYHEKYPIIESPENALAENELLCLALARLPLCYREAVILRVVAELPFKEIAQILSNIHKKKLTVSTVTTYAWRGKEALRQNYQNLQNEQREAPKKREAPKNRPP